MAITGLLKVMMTWGLLADCLYLFKCVCGGEPYLPQLHSQEQWLPWPAQAWSTEKVASALDTFLLGRQWRYKRSRQYSGLLKSLGYFRKWSVIWKASSLMLPQHLDLKSMLGKATHSSWTAPCQSRCHLPGKHRRSHCKWESRWCDWSRRNSGPGVLSLLQQGWVSLCKWPSVHTLPLEVAVRKSSLCRFGGYFPSL